MKKNMKRVVTLVLCAVMTLGLLAVSASADNDVSKVNTVKTVTSNGDGTYKVKLEAWAEDNVVIKSEKAYRPLDIVIAMDVSSNMNTYIEVGARDDLESVEKLDKDYGSNINVYQLKDKMLADHNQRMQYDPSLFLPEKFTDYNGTNKDTMGKSGWYYMAWRAVTGRDDTDHERGNNGWLPLEYAYAEGDKGIQIKKIDAEKIAVQNFLNDLEEKAATAKDKDGVDYRVSVVQYAANTPGSQGGTASGKSNIVIPMELVNSANVTSIKSKVITQSAFTDEPSGWGVNNNTARVTKGSNYLDQGLIQADNAFDSSSSAKKILILFSSGEPSRGAEAVTKAAEMDDVTIYTVAIGVDNISDGLKAIGNGGAYSVIYANDLNDKLETIFQQIESTTTTGGDNTSLDENTVLTDTITEYFQLAGTTATVHTEHNTATGFVNNGDAKTIAISGDTVSYSGFNYSENWVGTTDDNGNLTYHGKKLVIEFDIEPRAGFLGGNDVPTNVTESSGMYYNGTLVKNFNHCTADVAIPDLTVTAEDKNVYLLGSVDEAEMKKNVTIKAGTVNIDLTADNYGLEEWQNKFVNISVTTDGAKTNLKDDTTYTVTCTVTSKTNAENKSSASATAAINVFTPTLNHYDRTIYLGDRPVYFYTEAWKHNETSPTAVTMLGDKPKLTIIYNHKTFDDCHTDMNIETAKIGTTDVTEYVKCDDFAVHVLKPTLSASDVTIYRGDKVTDTILDAAMQNVTWACDCTAQKTTATSGSKPTATYDYGTVVDTWPADCTEVTATLKLDGETYSGYTKPFTVHVLQPNVAVTVRDAWADCGTEVDVITEDNTGACATYTLAWSDANSGHDLTDAKKLGTEPAFRKAPEYLLNGFGGGRTAESPTVGDADQDFTIKNVTFWFDNYYDYVWTPATGANATFTVHVNTFDLTISKTWTGAVCYKQDAIFKVSRQGSSEVLKVVIPQDKNSVTVAGLLCGQSYTVTEDTNWSWRWNSSTSNITTTQGRIHTHATEIATAKPDNCTVTMTFKNTLNKTQWLSGTDYVNNVYSGGSWSQVTESPVKKAVRALLGN